MEHVKFTHVRSSRIADGVRGSDPDGGSTRVVATRIIAWVDGYERPLLCSRVPASPGVVSFVLGANWTHAKLWTSPLRYSDPPSDPSLSPTGAPWVVYCEKNVSVEPFPPFTGTNPAYWEPLSADWTLKGALAPVVDVIRARHQPFLARLHARNDGSETFHTINIGAAPCLDCNGSGEVRVNSARRNLSKFTNFGTNIPPLALGDPITCVRCDGTGTLPRWSLSVQCGFNFNCAPQLRHAAVDNDLSQFYLWEVSSNIEREEVEGPNSIVKRFVDSKLTWPTDLARARATHHGDFGAYLHGLAARVCNGEHDPATNVYASELQLVIDALEWEAQNTDGPALGPVETTASNGPNIPIGGVGWGTPLARIATRGAAINAGMDAKQFVDAIRRGEPTRADLEKLRDTWRVQWPEVAEYIDRVFAGDPTTDIVVQRSRESTHQPTRESTHQPTWDGRTSRVDSTSRVESNDMFGSVVTGIRLNGVRYRSTEEMNAAFQRESKNRQDNRERSQFKRGDTKRSPSSPKGRR